MEFSSDFDAGNGILESIVENTVCVKVADDAYTIVENKTHKQWFYFRLSNVPANQPISINITNAGNCAFPAAWPGYDVCASINRQDWFRLPTNYAEGALSWSFTTPASQMYFAYFPPYSRERHLDLIAECSSNPSCKVSSLGKSLEARDMDMITFGSGPLNVWIIARQHPGETMAEWVVQGMLRRLLNSRDAVSRHLALDATFRIVPNMNPDGSYHGYLRTNASGANLNREWCATGDYEAPTMARSPEVFHVLHECDRVGCDMFIDFHGDEALPHNFISGSEGCAVWGERLNQLQTHFCSALIKANPNFQTKYGYGADEPLQANYAICSNQIAQRYKCLAFTFESPFKSVVDYRGVQSSWLHSESEDMGATVLDAIAHVLPHLRL